MTTQLLLVDDDLRLGAMIGEYLRPAGFAMRQATSLAHARLELAREPVSLMVLDLMLPDGDGLDWCRTLREDPLWARLPILMLSARGEPTDRIVGLELGADDYLAKPFEPRELLARVKALLRRQTAAPGSAPQGRPVLTFGRLSIDRDARVARLGTERCELTGHQFDLLVVLAEAAGRVMSREQIMESLKGKSLEAFDRSIDVHVSRIRAAIEEDPRQPQRLLTMRGAGYMLVRSGDPG